MKGQDWLVGESTAPLGAVKGEARTSDVGNGRDGGEGGVPLLFRATSLFSRFHAARIGKAYNSRNRQNPYGLNVVEKL